MIGCCPNTLFACQRSFCINLMILKFAVIVAAVLLLLPAHADAKNIVKAGSDILVEEDYKQSRMGERKRPGGIPFTFLRIPDFCIRAIAR